MISHQNTIRCDDDSIITKTPGQATACFYWRPGLKGGRERGYYNGIVHHMFKIVKPDGRLTVVIALN